MGAAICDGAGAGEDIGDVLATGTGEKVGGNVLATGTRDTGNVLATGTGEKIGNVLATGSGDTGNVLATGIGDIGNVLATGIGDIGNVLATGLGDIGNVLATGTANAAVLGRISGVIGVVAFCLRNGPGEAVRAGPGDTPRDIPEDPLRGGGNGPPLVEGARAASTANGGCTCAGGLRGRSGEMVPRLGEEGLPGVPSCGRRVHTVFRNGA